MYYSGAWRLINPRKNRPAKGTASGDNGSPFLVLLYHRVQPRLDPFSPSLSIDKFESQMRYLAKHFNVLTLAEIFDGIKKGKSLSPKTVAITFDDGYRDNFLHAHPILKHYGLPATLFVSTGYIDTGRVMWNDRVAWAIQHATVESVDFELAPEPCRLSLRTENEKKNALERVLAVLKTLSELKKQEIVDELVVELGNGHVGPEPSMLSWNELRILRGERWEIGSHTVNHAILTRLTEAESLSELSESKSTLERELQVPVRFFAYPNGKPVDFSSNIKDHLQRLGYEAAVTTIDGMNSESTDLFELRRRSPWEEYLPSFAAKMQLSFWRQREAKPELRPDLIRRSI